MAKKFNIHEWQAKRRLVEQEEFTPDLEDDELKRGAIQQMMDKEKPKTPQDVPQGTLNNTIADLAEMYSYGEILDSLKVFYTDNGEQPYADMAKKHAKEFRDFLDSEDGDEMFMGDWGPHLAEEDLDENMTGTGASMQAGEGMGHFGKSKKKRANTPSGDMAYTQNVNEQEEQPTDGEQPTDDTAKEEEIVDTALELGAQLKDLGSSLKGPAGQRGFETQEITIFSKLIAQLVDDMKQGNATSLLSKINNILN